MWSGPKQNEEPAPTAVARCSPPIRGLDSVRTPWTTRTAPEERSWSCQPVSFCRVQHSSQTSTNSSRYSEA